ncbi:synaptonemal complex protein ZIP1-like [Pieris napi]|uniref:synaptonemal complex protein ZIP1-like n=1 Tax=Pieris napi TaxID=78633 RepID=UPI001FBBAB69|nr:synaptonemal complex protein ZIP1-like [Pieris napi]
MDKECKENWKCPECYFKTPKPTNMNTPTSARACEGIQSENTPSQSSNITIRKPKIPNNDSINSEDLSILGDTLNSHLTEAIQSQNEQTKLILENLKEMLDTQLKNNNKSIITELRATIQGEINQAIDKFREEIRSGTIYLKKENSLRKLEIGEIRNTIEKLTKENENIKNELKKLTTSLGSLSSMATSTTDNPEKNNNRTIVLYGLHEYYKEHEDDTHNRVIDIFRDILNIDLTGYIEETRRVGKYTYDYNRPLIIELISKRTVKFILENTNYFKGTGLSVIEFLDKNARRERKIMREQMIKARKNGQHAIIKNNQLYIERKLIKIKLDNANNSSEEQMTHYNETERYSTDQPGQSALPNYDAYQQHSNNNSFRKTRYSSENPLPKFPESLQ